MYYTWQEDASKKIKGSDAIISAPTGSGKTYVAYQWSEMPLAFQGKHKVIYTAPIKALANEKYYELAELYGENSVGLITGDIVKNPKSPIVVCTQEVYTRKFARRNEKMKVIVDEFHYIFSDNQRTRAYIDGLMISNPNHNFLLLSATFGNPRKIKEYLERISGRKFILYETDFRPTQIVFTDKVFEIQNIPPYSLIYVFNISLIKKMVRYASSILPYLPYVKRRRIKLLAIDYKVDVEKFPELFNGVASYHSKLTYSQKKFIERIIREKLVNIVFSTNALGVGVNLPFENVLFASLTKPNGENFEPITKIEFLQLSGRAGRKGFFEVGYVGLLKHSFDRKVSFKQLQDQYKQILYKEIEQPEILLTFDYEKIVKGERTIEEEVDYISKYSEPPIDRRIVEEVGNEIKEIVSKIDHNTKELLNEIYLPELTLEQNIELAKRILNSEIYQRESKRLKRIISAFKVSSDILNFLKEKAFEYEGEYLNFLLKLRRVMRKTHYRKFRDIYIYWQDIHEVENKIRSIDPLVLGGV